MTHESPIVVVWRLEPWASTVPQENAGEISESFALAPKLVPKLARAE